MGRTQKEVPPKNCAHCGSPFQRTRYNGVLEDASRFEKRLYCSKACSALAHRLESPSRSAMLKRIVKKRKPSCAKCGARSRLSNHHKDRDWRNNDPSNLETLCSSCHTSLHHEADEIHPSTPRSPCSVCGKPSYRRALCATHLTRFKLYGDPRLTKRRVDGFWKLASDT